MKHTEKVEETTCSDCNGEDMKEKYYLQSQMNERCLVQSLSNKMHPIYEFCSGLSRRPKFTSKQGTSVTTRGVREKFI